MKRYGKFLIWFSVVLIMLGCTACYFTFTEYDFYRKVEAYNAAQDVEESGETLKRLAEFDGDKAKAAEYEAKIKEAARISFEYWDYHIKAEYEREPNWVLPACITAASFTLGVSLLMIGIFVFSLGSHQNKLLKEVNKLGAVIEGNTSVLFQSIEMVGNVISSKQKEDVSEREQDFTPYTEERRTRRSRTARITSIPPDSESSSDTPDRQ